MSLIFCIVESVEPVSTIHHESTKGRIELRERSITCSSFFTIITRAKVEGGFSGASAIIVGYIGMSLM